MHFLISIYFVCTISPYECGLAHTTISSSTAPGLWLAKWLHRKKSTFPSKEPPTIIFWLRACKVLIAIARFLLIITCSQINLYALSQLNLHLCSQINLHAFKLLWLYTTVATYPLEIISASTANSQALQYLQAFAAKEFK